MFRADASILRTRLFAQYHWYAYVPGRPLQLHREMPLDERRVTAEYIQSALPNIEISMDTVDIGAHRYFANPTCRYTSLQHLHTMQFQMAVTGAGIAGIAGIAFIFLRIPDWCRLLANAPFSLECVDLIAYGAVWYCRLLSGEYDNAIKFFLLHTIIGSRSTYHLHGREAHHGKIYRGRCGRIQCLRRSCGRRIHACAQAHRGMPLPLISRCHC